MNTITPREALQKAIRIAGTQWALANAITALRPVKPGGEPIVVRQGHVTKWLTRGWVPAEVCIAIERAVESRVTRYELRPDVFTPNHLEVSA